MLLNKEFNLDSKIEKVITGRFFPTRKSKYNDILVLKSNEIYIYNGEYVSRSGCLSGNTSDFDDSNISSEELLFYKLDTPCIELWKYSISGTKSDFIIILDLNYNLILLSVKRISVPHLNNFTNCSVSKINDQFNLNGMIFTEKFVIQRESSVNISPKNVCNLSYCNNINRQSSGNTDTDRQSIIFSFDYLTGFIVISLNGLNIIFISSKVTFSKENFIENIQLKLGSCNLIYINQSEYKLLDMSLIGNSLKKKTMILALMQKTDSLIPYYQIFIPNWEYVLTSNSFASYSTCHPFFHDNNDKPIIKSTKFELRNPEMIINENQLDLINSSFNTQSISSLSCTNNPHVFHMRTCMQANTNNQAFGEEFGSERLILVYDFNFNQIIILSGNFFSCIEKLNKVKDDDFKSKLYKSVFGEDGFDDNFEYEHIQSELEVKYLSIGNISKSNINKKSRVSIMQGFFEKNKGLFTTLLLINHSTILVLEIYFENGRISRTELKEQNIPDIKNSLPDIVTVNEYSVESSSENFECLISSSIGIIRRVKFPELQVVDIIVSITNELINVKESITVDNCKITLVLENKVFNGIELKHKHECDWRECTYLRLIEINSPKIEYLYNSNVIKHGICGICSFNINEDIFLLFYLKPMGHCELEFLVKCCKDINSVEKDNMYYLKKIKNHFFGRDDNNDMFSFVITFGVVSMGNNKYLNVTNRGIILTEIKFLEMNSDENIYANNNVFAESRYVWKLKDRNDEIMFTSIVNELTVLLLTQEKKLVKFEIDVYNNVAVTNMIDVDFVSIITTFDSKLELFDSEYGLFILIGSSYSNIYCLFSPIGEERYRIKELKLEGDYENNDKFVVTSIVISKDSDKNVYVISSYGAIYIYDISMMVNFIFLEKLCLKAKYIIHLRNYIADLNDGIDQIDWKIVSKESEQIEATDIIKTRMVLCSTLYYLIIELLEYRSDIMCVGVNKVILPEFSVYSPLNKNGNTGFYVDGTTKKLHMIKLDNNKANFRDIDIGLNNELEEFDKMLYLKKSKVIVLNTITKKVLEHKSINNDENSDYDSKIMFLDLNGNLIGKMYYYDLTMENEIPYKIFSFDNKSIFIQTVINNKYTKINLLSLSNCNSNLSIRDDDDDRIYKYGSCILYNLRVEFILKCPNNSKIFVFISKILYNESISDNKNNRFLISLYKFEIDRKIQKSTSKNNTGLVFSDKLELVKLSDVEMTDVKFITFAEFVQTNKNCSNLIGTLVMDITKNCDSKINIHLNINKNANDGYVFSNGNTIDCMDLCIKSRELKYLCDKKPITSLINKSLIVGMPFEMKKESILFIFGVSVITNYLHKRNQNISLIPLNASSLLFKLFDIIIKSANQNEIFSNKCSLVRRSTESKGKYQGNCSNYKKNFLNADNEEIESNQSKLCLFGENNTDKANYDINQILKHVGNINDNFISLYLNSCNKCFKWRVFMITVIWWNIMHLNHQSSSQTSNAVKQENEIKRLLCPLIPNWSLELPVPTSTTHFNLPGKSFIYSLMSREEVVKECYNAGIIIGHILLISRSSFK